MEIFLCVSRIGLNRMKNPKIDAIVFDIGKVIVDFDLNRPLQALASRTCLGIPEMKKKLLQSSLPLLLETGKLSVEEFCAGVRDLLELRMEPMDLVPAWATFFPDSLILDESFFAPFCRHYHMMILSNTSAMHIRFLRERFRVLDLFRTCIFSFETGTMKPEEAIYRSVEARAGCAPAKILFIDDIPDHIQTARNLGWNSLLFTGRESLESQFREMGIIDGPTRTTKE